jgi:hypothetical protein
MQLSSRIHQCKRLDVLHDGLKLQAAAMNIRAQRAAQGKSIGAGLLLYNAPRMRLACLAGEQAVDEFRPLDARLRMHDASFCIETKDTIHRAHVEQGSAAGELLSTHSMAATCDADRAVVRTRHAQYCAQRVDRVDVHDLAHPRCVELGMDVVHDYTCVAGALRANVWCNPECGARACQYA